MSLQQTVATGASRLAAPGVRAAPAGLLTVRGLKVVIESSDLTVHPVDGVDIEIAAGETYALLGESGCGKSMTALAIARLLPDRGRITSGAVMLSGQDLLRLPEAAMRTVRGGRLGMIFQEPASSLNPVMTVGAQISEALQRHGLRGASAAKEACALLEAVGIPDPQRRLRDYPFQFSGGMKQRVMIAIALAGRPELLIADEPTTALDVTIQAQVLELLRSVQQERAMGMLLITHDLGVVKQLAHRVGLMYAGELVETGSREAFFRRPLHPYARKLFAALPHANQRGAALDAPIGSVPPLDRSFAGCRFVDRCVFAFDRCDDEVPRWHEFDGQAVRCHLYEGLDTPGSLPQGAVRLAPWQLAPSRSSVLEVDTLSVHFPIRKGLLQRTVGVVRAVDELSLSLFPGRTLALVGESGCGKTTAGKAILKLIEASAGQVLLDGEEVRADDPLQMDRLRRAVQMVFQDPFSSLNPRMRIGDIIEEGMRSLGVEGNSAQRRERVAMLLERVGLSAAMSARYPHEFSGGQRQRIAMARALAVRPRVLVCDEPTSALDVSVQAQLLNLMRELQQEHDLAYLFITHNLAVVEYLADEVAVMYLGRIVEQGPAQKVLQAPVHPYTRALLAAVPRLDEAAAEHGQSQFRPPPGAELPSPLQPPSGCHFHPRCSRATEICRLSYPPQGELGQGHRYRCHWPCLDE